MESLGGKDATNRDPSALSIPPQQSSTRQGCKTMATVSTQTTSPNRQLCHAEWEELKPLIWRLYIKENRTFKSIARILCEQKNFLPTKRQFTRRVGEWGFKKNWPQNVISAVSTSTHKVKSPPTAKNQTSLQPGSCGHQDMPTGDDGYHQCVKSAGLSEESPSFTVPISFIEIERSMKLKRREIGLSNTVLGLEGICTLTEHDKITFCNLEMSSEHYHSDHWSFDRWAEVDVPGSPKLTRMFAALEIRFPLEDDPLTLIDTSNNDECSKYVSNIELQALCSVVVGNDESNVNITHQLKRKGIMAVQSRSHQLSPGSAKLIERIDTLFASDASQNPHPFNEISPFGISESVPAISEFSVSSLRAQACHYNDTLKKLLLVCPESSPGVLATMTSLASTHHDLGNDRQAEKWYRQVIGAKRPADCLTSPEELFLQLDLINSIMEQGKYKEAEAMHLPVHCAILAMSDAPRKLMAQSLVTKSMIFSDMGNFKEAESLRREEVQFCLTMFGPEHAKSALALSRLAETIYQVGQFSESERLFRIAAQIQISNTGTFDARLSTTLRQLLRVLLTTGRASEWQNLGRSLIERSKVIWGDEHEETFRCSYQLAIALRRSGFDQESTEILEGTLKQQTKVLGRLHPDTLCTMFELGWNLMIDHRIQEAIPLLEEELWGRLEAHGPASQWTLWSCKMLGLRCYQSLERFGDALALWKLLIEKIECEEGPDHPAIKEVEQWIDKYSYHWDEKLKTWCMVRKPKRTISHDGTNWDFFEL